MLLLDDPLLLYRRRKQYSLSDYLKEHLKQVHALQYQTEDDIRNVCKYLSRELAKHAKKHSPVYKNHRGVIDKSHLKDKNQWYVDGFHAHAATTGGSTTGQPFHYNRWATHYNQIEGEIHYRAILNEFGLERPVQILYLMLDLTDDRHNIELVKVYQTDNLLISHGQGRLATVHEVVRGRHYYLDYLGFYDAIFAYCDQHDIDVVLAPGQAIASLAWNARRLKRSKPICRLLSNTGDKVSRADLDSLEPIVSSWCDHMRCWDGGITFMTCRYKTPHLLDGLAWTRSDKQNRLISDDYYSLPSPFVNYWNGDHGQVGDTYKRCECGRLYRDFAIQRTRSVTMAGVTNHKVRDNILKTTVDTSDIIRAESTQSFIRIFTKRSYTAQERLQIRQALPAMEVNFVTEEPNG